MGAPPTVTLSNSGKFTNLPYGGKILSTRVPVVLADLVSAGAALVANILLLNLPARYVVRNVLFVLTTPFAGAGLGVATVSIGRTGAAYIDYVVASNVMAPAVANTVYGDAAGERGANNVMYDLPSYVAAVPIYAQATLVGINLNALTAGGFDAIFQGEELP